MDAGSSPIVPEFNSWLEEARKTDLPEPSAFSLATVGRDGQPSVRVVLLIYPE